VAQLPKVGIPRSWHHEYLPKQALTVELEEDVISAARAEVSRKGQPEAAVVEQALREHLSLGSSVTDQDGAIAGGVVPEGGGLGVFNLDRVRLSDRRAIWSRVEPP
jgi:hypothetical protein